MHEISLMANILATLRESALQNGIKNITQIKLVVGKFSMALPDSLLFAFEALGTQDELFMGAKLDIEEKDTKCICRDCHHPFTLDNEYYFICPHCSGHKVEIISGRELYIDYYEGD